MNRFRSLQRGAILGTVLGIVAVVAIAGAVTFYFYCPCERLPGGWLLGDEVTEPVRDWSFANDVPLCQIEVRSVLPHSVNLNCMASEGELFLSCARCEGKYWSDAALANPAGRIRMNESVYPVTLTRVTDPALLDRAWRARANKLGAPVDTPRPDEWWSFQLVSR